MLDPLNESRIATGLLDDLTARADARSAAHQTWIEARRNADPEFREASVLRPADDYAYQAAVYLLSGDEELWDRLRAEILAAPTAAQVHEYIHALLRSVDWSDPERTASDFLALEWAAHLADPSVFLVAFPEAIAFEWTGFVSLFQRWIEALCIRGGWPPSTFNHS